MSTEAGDRGSRGGSDRPEEKGQRPVAPSATRTTARGRCSEERKKREFNFFYCFLDGENFESIFGFVITSFSKLS